jgi:hypothetical protein
VTLAAPFRKAALSMHVVSSVGWMGAVAAFLALAIVGLTSDDGSVVRSSYVAMDLTTRYVIVPLAVAALVTGLVQSLGTSWGLFRHYWVVVKLVVTVVATAVLVLQVATISDLAAAASSGSIAADDLREDRVSLVLHAGVGLLVLAVPLVLSIYKPRGVTAYGRRRTTAQAE